MLSDDWWLPSSSETVLTLTEIRFHTFDMAIQIGCILLTHERTQENDRRLLPSTPQHVASISR